MIHGPSNVKFTQLSNQWLPGDFPGSKNLYGSFMVFSAGRGTYLWFLMDNALAMHLDFLLISESVQFRLSCGAKAEQS